MGAGGPPAVIRGAARDGRSGMTEIAETQAGAAEAYRLDEQVGFLLRRAQQRHLAIFGRLIPELTPTQFAALARAFELGPVSQAALGRATAMDAATIKGVTDRLEARGLVATAPCGDDRRRVLVRLTAEGARLFRDAAGRAAAVTAETLAPLSLAERRRLVELLRKIG
jgi:MarR family transcriptional regulator, lower aerobic nicotinate degradation pathway regulator